MKNNNYLMAIALLLIISVAGIIAYMQLNPTTTAANTTPNNNNSNGGILGFLGLNQNTGYDNGYFSNWDFLTDGTSGTTNEGNTATYYDSSIPDSDGSNDYNSGPTVFDAIGGFFGGLFAGSNPSDGGSNSSNPVAGGSNVNLA